MDKNVSNVSYFNVVYRREIWREMTAIWRGNFSISPVISEENLEIKEKNEKMAFKHTIQVYNMLIIKKNSRPHSRSQHFFVVYKFFEY